jgi:hypothetical protein
MAQLTTYQTNTQKIINNRIYNVSSRGEDDSNGSTSIWSDIFCSCEEEEEEEEEEVTNLLLLEEVNNALDELETTNNPPPPQRATTADSEGEGEAD